MKKLWLIPVVLAAVLYDWVYTGYVHAGVSCALPFNLLNNTTADATQVMANYNAIVACLGNAAAAGTNADITSLTALVTPINPSQGGTSSFIGGTSTGTNTVVITANPTAGFSLTTGYKASFTVGVSNTAATTLNVNSTGNINVFRHTHIGTTTFVGGEWQAGARVAVEFDGTQWQWMGPTIIVGAIYDYAGATCPIGMVAANNQTVLRSSLLGVGVLGGFWGPGDGVTTYNVPDLRARATYGQDQNVSGFANRITVAGGNFDGTVFANSGGLQNHTLTTAELAVHLHSITDPGHVHTIPAVSAGSGTSLSAVNSITVQTGTTNSAVTGITQTNNAGSGSAHTILAPAAIVNKCIQL